jgi:hypothetical protein
MDELCLRLPEKSLGKEEGAELVSESRTGETRRGNRLRSSTMVILELLETAPLDLVDAGSALEKKTAQSEDNVGAARDLRSSEFRCVCERQ